MENPRPDRRIRPRLAKNLLEMLRPPRPTTRYHRYRHHLLHRPDQLEIEPRVRPVAVYGIQEDFACAHSLDGQDEGLHGEGVGFAAAVGGALVPHPLSSRGRVRVLGAERGVGCRRGWTIDKDAFRIHAHDHSLASVRAADRLDGRLPTQLLAAGIVFLCGNDGVGADADFIRAAGKIELRDVEGGDGGAGGGVDGGADAAADGEGDEDGQAGLAEDFEHGEVG